MERPVKEAASSFLMLTQRRYTSVSRLSLTVAPAQRKAELLTESCLPDWCKRESPTEKDPPVRHRRPCLGGPILFLADVSLGSGSGMHAGAVAWFLVKASMRRERKSFSHSCIAYHSTLPMWNFVCRKEFPAFRRVGSGEKRDGTSIPALLPRGSWSLIAGRS
jgi:hypothetical protein